MRVRTSSLRLWKNVVDFQNVVVCPEKQSAIGAFAVLLLEKFRPAGADAGMFPHAHRPVHPVPVINAAFASQCIQAGYFPRMAGQYFFSVRRSERPFSGFEPPIFSGYPSRAALWVPPEGPSPELVIEDEIHSVQLPIYADGVVVRPSGDFGI